MSKYFTEKGIHLNFGSHDFYLSKKIFLKQLPNGDFFKFFKNLQNIIVHGDEIYVKHKFFNGCGTTYKTLKFPVGGDFTTIEPVFLTKTLKINENKQFINLPPIKAELIKIHLIIEAENAEENAYVKVGDKYIFGNSRFAADLTVFNGLSLDMHLSGITGKIHVKIIITHFR